MALAARHSQRAALQAQAVGHRDAAASRRWGRWRGAPADTGAKIPFDLPIRRARGRLSRMALTARPHLVAHARTRAAWMAPLRSYGTDRHCSTYPLGCYS